LFEVRAGQKGGHSRKFAHAKPIAFEKDRERVSHGFIIGNYGDYCGCFHAFNSAARATGSGRITARNCAYFWGTARREHAGLIRGLGATPIDYQREDVTRVLPDGFDIVFDGIGEEGYRRALAALKRGGLLCAYGYTAGVQEQRRMLTMLLRVARLYLWRWFPGGKHARGYSRSM
jgi:hypothetical protein